jgi:hypothetical protein
MIAAAAEQVAAADVADERQFPTCRPVGIQCPVGVEIGVHATTHKRQRGRIQLAGMPRQMCFHGSTDHRVEPGRQFLDGAADHPGVIQRHRARGERRTGLG